MLSKCYKQQYQNLQLLHIQTMPKVLIVKHAYYQWSLKAKLFCHKTIKRNLVSANNSSIACKSNCKTWNDNGLLEIKNMRVLYVNS